MDSAKTKNIAIIGSGHMGRGIAQVAICSGFSCVLVDILEDKVQEAQKFIEKQLEKGIEKGKWERAYVTAALSRLKGSTDFNLLKKMVKFVRRNGKREVRQCLLISMHKKLKIIGRII